MNTIDHLHEEQVSGYIYRTLCDAERETIDRHLVTCPICRGRVTQHEIYQHQIENDMKSLINNLNPSAGMNFTGIAPSLKRRGLRFAFPVLTTAVPLGTTLVGLVLAVWGLWQVVGSFSVGQPNMQTGTLPALACFCLMFVSMDQYDRSYTLRPRFILAMILAILLWLGSAVLGFLNILAMRDIALIVAYNAGRTAAEANSAAILAIYLGAIAFIAMVIGGAEYHYRRIGHPSSWKVFLWTIGLQLLVMITPYLLW
jgi:hypothetical protein